MQQHQAASLEIRSARCALQAIMELAVMQESVRPHLKQHVPSVLLVDTAQSSVRYQIPRVRCAQLENLVLALAQ